MNNTGFNWENLVNLTKNYLKIYKKSQMIVKKYPNKENYCCKLLIKAV